MERNTSFSLETLNKIKSDSWYFASNCVFTLDQVDSKSPIKKFPSHWKYLKLFFRLWEIERFIAIPKSRRMFMSWANIVLHLHYTFSKQGRHIAFVSKKEDDADELVRKARFIMENIPEEVWPKELRPRHEYKYGQLIFPEIDSKIQGFPQGADQLRQFTFSAIMADEMAFWEDAEQMYAASFPTLEGGGKFTAISSPGPGFFKRLVFDQIGNKEKDFTPDEIESTIDRFPMEGVEVWKNPKNKFLIYQLHYSANENKRDPNYRDSVKSAMPHRQYMQEYELQWDSFIGLPVFADWDQSFHGVTKRIEPEVGLPLLRGWDFGLSPACVIAQLQGDSLCILMEIIEVNMGIDRFSDRVLTVCKTLFPQWWDQRKHWMDFIDPSGQFRKDTDETSCAVIMEAKGMKCIPGAIAWEERRSSVEQYLTKRTKEGPGLKVNLSLCPLLVRGFNGGYRYDEGNLEREPNKVRPLKDEHSHVQDALQMITSRMVSMRHRSHIVRVPRPSYTFGTDRGARMQWK